MDAFLSTTHEWLVSFFGGGPVSSADVVSQQLLLITCCVICMISTGKKVWKAVVEIEGCNQVNHVAVSPDGQYMVCVAQDDTLSTWRCEDVLKGTAIQPQKRSYFVNNSDNRKWLSTIRPVFDQTQPHSFVIGSMEDERCINFFTLGGKGEEDHVTSALKYCDEVCPRIGGVHHFASHLLLLVK